ncbi:MAG: hypothetical protein KGJ31_01485 [Patescibacteria group bacterium]|nr:hypothetical protein [Patescibacteria group bacterium]
MAKNEYESYFEDTEKRTHRIEVGVDAYVNSKLTVKDGKVVSELKPTDLMELSKTLNQIDIIKRRRLGLPERWR